MANRYWRGGSGSWDTSSTGNWSATSGGAGGASVPTAADSVFFDQAGTYTVTLSSAITCLDITVSAGTVTFGTGTSPALAISGSMSLIAGTVWTGGGITFNATTTGKTITTNGTVFGGISINFSGVGGGWTLGSSFTGTSSTNLIINNGTFNSGNFSINVGNLVSNGASTRTINLGSSTITLQGGSTPINFAATGLTFNAGTSQINLTGTGGSSFVGAGQTFYNVAWTASPTTTGVVRSVTGANTFNNLTLVPRATTDVVAYAFTANQTINGTLTISPSTNATMRVALVPASNFGYAATLGVTRTLTCNAVSTLTDVDFMDIAFAGNCVSGGNLTGTRLGDMKGNSGITFTPGTTKYWNLAAGGNWSATAWATSSGGTPAITNFPLAQDTCVFEATGLNSGATVTVNVGYALGTIDMSARTSNTMTFNAGTGAPFIFGNFVNGTGVTLTGTNGIVFGGRTSQTITSVGVSFGFPININSPGGTVIPQDATTVTTGICFFINGTLDLNNLTWTANTFSQSGANGSPVLAFNTGNITLTGSGVVFSGSTNTTVTGTPNVYLVYSGASSVTITPGQTITEANSINFIVTAGSYTLTVTGSNVVRNLDFSNGGLSTFTGSMGGATGTITVYGNLTLKSGMSVVAGTASVILSATSGTKTITSAGVLFDRPITFSGLGGTFQLQDNLTVGSTRTTAFNNGTLDLNTKTLSTGVFTDNTNSKVLAFGTGNITLTGSGTVWNGNTNTTVTGTPNVYLTYSGAAAVTLSPASPSEARSINFIVTAGSYALTINTAQAVKNLDFSNGGTSTYTGNWAGTTNTLTMYGNLTLKSGMTVSGTGAITFAATSGTKTITSAGLTNTHPMTFNDVGGTWQLQDALNIGSNTLTLTNGTFDANSYNVTAGSFSSSNTNTRTIAVGSGTWSLSGSGASIPWSTATPGLTLTGTGTISLTAATAKTFSGGDVAFTNITLNQGGAGALTISGINTFKDITATYTATAATTITFTASTTQTVSQFTGAGAAAKLLTLNSATAGTQATIALSGGGTVSTDYLSVQDIAFTPEPSANGTTPYSWYLGANSLGKNTYQNNSGAIFAAGGPGVLYVYRITNTATTSWTVPNNWDSSNNTIHLIGGGGGGGGGRATSTTNKAGGGGGGGGGYRSITNYSATAGSSISIAVGAGGTAGASAGGTGGTGGTTSWAGTTATGGTGGSTTTTPTSVGGTGGAGTFSGGTGGAGSTTTTSAVGVAGGGGAGAAGPNGVGGNGGIGFSSSSNSNVAGGGGGANGGGANGGNATAATGGTGGASLDGGGGGGSNNFGYNGGGSGGGVNAAAKTAGRGIDILNSLGSGGGAGGSPISNPGTAGALYGAGGGGSGVSLTTVTNTGGAGAQGAIIIAYVPGAAPVSTNSNFFMLWN